MTTPSTGIIYISFGEVSAKAASESLASIRKYWVDAPAISVGTTPVEGTTFIPWKGHSPWKKGAPVKYGFYAAYVKPFLYQYTPFEYNLYLDADTEAYGDVSLGLKFLDEHDLCIAHSRRWYVEDQYRDEGVSGPEWDIPKKERDYTTQVLGKPRNKLINSGVIFFRKNEATEVFFKEWFQEWKRFSHWDEQLAFLRTEHNLPNTKILHLPSVWNYHHRILPDEPVFIWHKWWTARDRGVNDNASIQLEKSDNLQDAFTSIYSTHFWLSKETVSGRGSEIGCTGEIRTWLPQFIKDYQIKSIRDAGCGDFNWMKKVSIDIPYLGCDIVPALILHNQNQYGSEKWPVKRFEVADITKDTLNVVDLTLCRDVLFHLCYQNIGLAIRNLASSTLRYILMTNNPRTNINNDVEDGGFRRLNYFLPPFNLPQPLKRFPDCVQASEEMLLYDPTTLKEAVKGI